MEQSKIKRLWQHWLHPRMRVEKYFPENVLQQLAAEIGTSEQNHHGQIRFVVESRLDSADILAGLTPRQRACQWFGELGVWDTEHNSGILIYIGFADHAVEIVTDRGINQRIDNQQWQRICDLMRDAFRQQNYADGLASGLRETDALLKTVWPKSPEQATDDSLPNDVVMR